MEAFSLVIHVPLEFSHAAVNSGLSTQLPSLAKTSALLLLRFLWQTVVLILVGAGVVQLRNHCTR